LVPLAQGAVEAFAIRREGKLAGADDGVEALDRLAGLGRYELEIAARPAGAVQKGDLLAIGRPARLRREPRRRRQAFHGPTRRRHAPDAALVREDHILAVG